MFRMSTSLSTILTCNRSHTSNYYINAVEPSN